MSLIPIVTACNQRCLFCSAQGRGDSPTLKGVLAAVDKLAASGGGTLVLSGGETTFSPDLPLIVGKAKARGLKIELQTNGLTSCYPERARSLAALGADLFNINFPSHLPAVNDRITGTKGTLPHRVAGVLNLLKAGASVRLTHIISSPNYRGLPAFAAYAARKFPGVRYIQFSYLKGVGAALENAWLLPPYAKVAPLLQRALAFCEKRGVEAVVDHIPPCFLGAHYARHIDVIKASTGQDTSVSRSEKKRLPACKGCALTWGCFGPRIEHVRMLKGTELVRPAAVPPTAKGKGKC